MKKIGKNIQIRGDNISDLDTLVEIGENADFEYTSNIKSLRNLNKVGGNLYLKNSKIEDITSLSYVGKTAYTDGSILSKEQIDYINSVAHTLY